jgi:hypothetical protein
MTVPVVLIHQHPTPRYHLDLVVAQAQTHNPGQVRLMTDESDFEVNIEDYFARAREFAFHYEHMSTNHRDFELFCIQRWFVLLAWMEANKVPVVLYTDSDVLLYANAEEEWAKYRECALTLCLGTSPATAFLTQVGLAAFVDFVESVYVNHNATFIEFQRIFREMQAQGLPGGICDMTLFKFFKEQVTHVKVGEMTQVIDGATWDHNINASDGYIMRRGIKDIEFVELDESEVPLGWKKNPVEQVRFNALHFQGQAKALIPQYVRIG